MPDPSPILDKLLNLFENAGHGNQPSTVSHDAVKKMMDGLQGELAPIESLPEAIQSFLSSIKGMDDGEKIHLINQFVNGWLQPKEELNEHRFFVTTHLNEIIEKGAGDCDDFASAKLTLLRYAGFDEKNLFDLGVTVNYEVKGANTMGGHAVCLVYSDNKFIVLDNNLPNPYELKEDLTAQTFIQNSSGQAVAVDVKALDLIALYPSEKYNEFRFLTFPSEKRTSQPSDHEKKFKDDLVKSFKDSIEKKSANLKFENVKPAEKTSISTLEKS